MGKENYCFDLKPECSFERAMLTGEGARFNGLVLRAE